MVHASLFSGIGGFDLAAAWMGWDNAFNCEIDPFCRKILKFHFPNAVQYDDIKATDFMGWRGRIDILSGGFPCQPFSTAGKRRGTSDDRYLWPEMLRAIREIRPRWVVGENVRGIVSWSEGLVFEQVHSDLEAEGYEAQAFVLPACGVNAPHKRERTWFVARRIATDPNNYGHATPKIGRGLGERDDDHSPREVEAVEPKGCTIPMSFVTADSLRTGLPIYQQGALSDLDGYDTGETVSGKQSSRLGALGEERFFTDTDCQRREKCNTTGKSEESNILSGGSNETRRCWQNFPTQPPVCSRDDGFPIPMDGITFSKWRNQSIKAYGNAIVPQVAYRIFDTIDTYDLIW